MLTDDPTNPKLKETRPDGQQEAYLVLSEEERKKGFVRPYRDTYVHVGWQPKYPLRDLTAEEKERYEPYGYVKYEEYPESKRPLTGRYWTENQLKASGCGETTTMARAIAETYARNPHFYGSTFCCGCGQHFRVDEFVWEGTSERVGS